MTSSGAIRNAFLCVLAAKITKDLANNTTLDLVHNIAGFTDPEKHHIFPQALLRRQEIDGSEVQALPNFCFLTSELNKRILDSQPSIYFADLMSKNPDFETSALSNLLPLGADSGIDKDEFRTFLNARATMLIDEIETLAGISVSGPTLPAQKLLSSTEVQIRDCIDGCLQFEYGSGYWATNIPSDIRIEVQKKVESALKGPITDPTIFKVSRHLLNLCNFGDYQKIIRNKSNWSLFAEVFFKENEFDRHFESLQAFRNSLMHSRKLDHLDRQAGMLAVAWFRERIGDWVNKCHSQSDPES